MAAEGSFGAAVPKPPEAGVGAAGKSRYRRAGYMTGTKADSGLKGPVCELRWYRGFPSLSDGELFLF